MPTFKAMKAYKPSSITDKEKMPKLSKFKLDIEKKYLEFLNHISKDIKKEWTTTEDLNNYGFKHLKSYKGAFPYDRMPVLRNGQSCIVNQDKAGEPGIHWFAVVKSNNKLYGYDSYGRMMDKYIHKKVINDQQDREQLLYNEENCGLRCLAWIHCYEKYGIRETMKI